MHDGGRDAVIVEPGPEDESRTRETLATHATRAFSLPRTAARDSSWNPLDEVVCLFRPDRRP